MFINVFRKALNYRRLIISLIIKNFIFRKSTIIYHNISLVFIIVKFNGVTSRTKLIITIFYDIFVSIKVVFHHIVRLIKLFRIFLGISYFVSGLVIFAAAEIFVYVFCVLSFIWLNAFQGLRIILRFSIWNLNVLLLFII